MHHLGSLGLNISGMYCYIRLFDGQSIDFLNLELTDISVNVYNVKSIVKEWDDTILIISQ